MTQGSTKKTIQWALLVGLLTVLCLGRLHAQAIYGSIYGQVTDPTGAAIPNATITVLDVSKGTSVSVKTDADGEYKVPNLIPDVYDVTASADGFRTLTNKGIPVAADSSPKVDLHLSLGGVTDTIQVTVEAPQLKTDRADVATSFNEKDMSTLPVAGRNFTNLEYQLPGSQKASFTQNGAENPQGSGQIMINGQEWAGIAYYLDGATNQDPILGQIVINPAFDAVTEAKIITQSFDPEFGQATAAVVMAQTKSGTNSIHGSVFDFRRTDAQLARNPYTQTSPNPITHLLVPSALYNQFGGAIGGPIIKNRTFAFFDYQGVRQRTGASQLTTVPTQLMHDSCLSGNGCDLSEYLSTSLGRGPNAGQIWNPRDIENGQPTAFANNFIPDALVSTQAKNLLKLLPYPTTTGTANNYAGSGNGIVNTNQFDVRVDDTVTQKVHAFARYSYFADNISAGTVFGAAGGPGFSGTSNFGGFAKGRNQSAVAGSDIALNNTLVTDFRLAYLRYHVRTRKYDGTDPFATNAGIPGLNLGTDFTGGAPSFFMTTAGGTQGDGIGNFGSGNQVNQCNCTLLENEDQYQIVNNWTKTLGTHYLKAGFDGRYDSNLRVPSDTNRAGQLTFSALDTENLQAPSGVAGGVGFASFLLGDITLFERFVSTSTNAKEYQKRLASYVQDSWRVTPNLTINYGVRWEIYFPETVNGKGNGGFADLSTGLIRVAGYGDYGSNMNVKSTLDLFGPRIGIAYQVRPKTVVRIGYGRSYAMGVFGSIFSQVLTQNLPTLAVQSDSVSTPNKHVYSLATGPNTFVAPPIQSDGTVKIPNGVVTRFRDDPNNFPTVDAWNLAVQQQLTGSLSLTVAYAANKGTDTFAGDSQHVNPNEAAACLDGSLTTTGQTLCWGSSNTSSTTTNANQLKKYYARYGWTQQLRYYHNGFSTNYNSLQITVEKHFAQGLQFTANYAFQRGFNFGNDFAGVGPKVVYGRFDELRENQLSLFGNYQLPFGRNRQFLASMPKWADYLVGGYQLGASANVSSGLPFTPTYGECSKDIPTGPCMPDKNGGRLKTSVGDLNPTTHKQTYFTPGPIMSANGATSGVFKRPMTATYGNVGRNNYFGPSYYNVDVSLMKDIPVHESVTAQFRVNAFNILNHINPGNPSTCIDCTVASGAGTITGMAIGAAPRQLEFSGRINF